MNARHTATKNTTPHHTKARTALAAVDWRGGGGVRSSAAATEMAVDEGQGTGGRGGGGGCGGDEMRIVDSVRSSTFKYHPGTRHIFSLAIHHRIPNPSQQSLQSDSGGRSGT